MNSKSMDNKFEYLFSPTNIGNLKVKNRIVRSATYELKASEGLISDEYLSFYKKLAEGGMGMIISGYGSVHSDNISDATPNIATDESIRGMNALVDTVHKYGQGCKMIFQLCHIGRQFRASNNTLLGPSPIKEPVFGNVPHEMTKGQIEECVMQFVSAIERVYRSGMDGVQLHAAHGWLLSTFLSPATNIRTDEYGGTTQNRTRILVEIIKEARKTVDPDFPILVKINANDYLEGGIEIDEAVKISKILTDCGYDALEISSCMWATTMRSRTELGWEPVMIPEARIHISKEEDEAYHRKFAAEIKAEIPDTPIILVGGNRSPRLLDEIIASGDADMVSMCRPFIREPGLVNRWMNGDERKAYCVSCNKCLDTLKERNFRCPVENP